MGRVQKPDKLALPFRLLSALLGLSFGFIGGQFWALPLKPDLMPEQTDAGTSARGIPPVGAPLPDRIAAAVRMDEDALAGVLAAVQEQWMRHSDEPGAAQEAMFQLRIIFSRWVDLSGVSALQAALKLKDSSLGDMALDALMSEWGLRDPLSASQSLTLIPWASAQERAALALARSSVKRSPADGLATATRLVAGAPAVRRGAAGAEWMRLDALHALRYLFNEPGIEASIPSGLALGQWLMDDPAALLAWQRQQQAAQHLPLLRFPAGSFTPGRLARLGAALTKEFTTLDAGLVWLHRAAGPAAQPVIIALSPAEKAMDNEMQSWLAARGTLAPVSTTPGWLPRVRHDRNISDILPRLAIPDPPAALRMLAMMPPEDDAALMAPAVTAWWLEQAPATASTQIFSANLTHPVAKAAASAAVDGLISSDPLKALDSLARLPLAPADIAAHRATAFRQLSLSSPAAMLDWLTAHPDITAPDSALTTAIKNLAAADTARAQEWVQKSAPANLRPLFTGAIFDLRLRTDRDGALGFLDSLPPGTERDSALASLITADIALSRRDQFFAGNLLPDTFVRALQITADTARLELLRSLLAAMKDTGVASAAALAHPQLRPADRAALTR